MVGVCQTAVAQERKIERSQLPAAVERAVAAQSQAATIRGFSQESERGQTLYEVDRSVPMVAPSRMESRIATE